MSRARAAFTLLELMLAVAIILMVMLVTVPSVRGMMAERRLRDTFEKLDSLARKAQLNAVSQQRAWSLSFDKEAVSMNADEPKPQATADGEEQEQEAPASIAIGENESYTLLRPASLLPPANTPARWTFWRSGTCEPVVVEYSGPDGKWSAQYNPLTGHGEITDQEVK